MVSNNSYLTKYGPTVINKHSRFGIPFQYFKTYEIHVSVEINNIFNYLLSDVDYLVQKREVYLLRDFGFGFITISRRTVHDQNFNGINGVIPQPENIERSLDRIVHMIQEYNDRSVKTSIHDDSIDIPRSSTRADKYIYFDQDGNLTVVSTAKTRFDSQLSVLESGDRAGKYLYFDHNGNLVTNEVHSMDYVTNHEYPYFFKVRSNGTNYIIDVTTGNYKDNISWNQRHEVNRV